LKPPLTHCVTIDSNSAAALDRDHLSFLHRLGSTTNHVDHDLPSACSAGMTLL
jgi:hypothetical protein